VLRIIKAKLKGEKVELPAEAEAPEEAEVVDLMDRLCQSLEARKMEGKPARQAKKAKARRVV
jgi:non-homologous end joining protein Ku